MQFGYVIDHIGERRHNRFAVVIFLPPPLEEIITPLRERYDPIYNLVGAHISLVFPFDARMSLEELVAAIRAETEHRKAFKVELSSIGDFYPADPVIYWGAKNSSDLTDLHFNLHIRLGLAVPHKAFQPHVTVAREISHHRVTLVKDKIAGWLPDEHFVVDKIDLITPVSGNKWVSVRTFRLKENPDALL